MKLPTSILVLSQPAYIHEVIYPHCSMTHGIFHCEYYSITSQGNAHICLITPIRHCPLTLNVLLNLSSYKLQFHNSVYVCKERQGNKKKYHNVYYASQACLNSTRCVRNLEKIFHLHCCCPIQKGQQ